MTFSSLNSPLNIIPPQKPCDCGSPTCQKSQALYDQVRAVFDDEGDPAQIMAVLILLTSKLYLSIYQGDKLAALAAMNDQGYISLARSETL
jgi:hypothetical protein